MVTRADPPRPGASESASGGASGGADRALPGTTDDGRSRRERLKDGAVVVIPAAMAAVLCLVEITGRSLGFDEAASVAIASQHGGAFGSAIAHDGGNMTGYYALLHVLIGIFGNGLLVVRSPSVLASAASVAVVGVLALRLFGRRVALASGLLAAVSLPLVFWGQDARGYAPMVALVAASFLAFAALVEGESDERPRRWPWIAYAVFTTLALYASFVAALVVAAQLVALAIHRRPLRRVVTALALSAVCCVPLVVLAVRRGSGQLFWVPRPNLTGEKQVIEALTSSGLQPNFRVTSLTSVLLGLTVLLLAVVTLRIVRALWRRADRRASWGQTLVLSWLIVPVALSWLESLLGQPMFVPRNLLMLLPAVALLLGWGIAGRSVPRLVTWFMLAVLIALRALVLAPSYGVSPENWRAATAYVVAQARPGDCVAFYPTDGRMAFQYYVGVGTSAAARAPRSVLPVVPWGEVRPYVEDYRTLPRSELSRLPSQCPRLWFVASHQGQRSGPPKSQANYIRYRALLTALGGKYRHRRTLSFGYASAVRVELLAG